MAQSYYSFYGSRLHLILEDEIAEAYNRVAAEFIEAQVRHEQIRGVKWNPDEPLLMKTNDKDQEAYKKVGDVIRLLCEINGSGLDIPEEECTHDGLVKL